MKREVFDGSFRQHPDSARQLRHGVRTGHRRRRVRLEGRLHYAGELSEPVAREERADPQGQALPLLFCDRFMSSENVIKDMEQENFRPATLRELAAFGAKNPDEQRKCGIIGLGSVMNRNDIHSVPYLELYGSERHMGVAWWGNDWPDRFCFLAVSKS